MPDEFLTPFDTAYDRWKTDADAAPDPGRVQTPEQESAIERDYWNFETECQEFALRYGWPALLSAVGSAMKGSK